MALVQRQRVASKLHLADSLPPWAACLLLPCNLFQVAAALEQQHYANPPLPPSSMRPSTSAGWRLPRLSAPRPVALSWPWVQAGRRCVGGRWCQRMHPCDMPGRSTALRKTSAVPPLSKLLPSL
jgi:hypothetical protein